MRAVRAFKAKITSHCTPLTSKEISEAECRWIKDSQKDVNREGCLKSQLNLFLDEKSLWRCGGRLKNADLPYFTKYPILLPRKHPIAPLIVNDAHRQYFTMVCVTL